MSIDPKYGRYCDECGRTIDKAHRIFENNDYCSICYPRVFVSQPCTYCGQSARVHRLANGPPVCRACRAGRICVRCEKPIIKAGMISAGKPLCPSCVSHFKTASPCAACGTPSTRLSAMPSAGILQKVCASCRAKVTHKTCSVCRKYRKVAGLTEESKPYCHACTPEAPVTHSCPECGVAVPGSGTAKCRPCLNRARLAKEVDLTALALTRDWTRALYRQFAQWLFERQPDNPNLMKVFQSDQVFFERVDAQYLHVDELNGPALLQTFGTSGLRKHLLVTQYLAATLSLEISPAEKARAQTLSEFARSCKRIKTNLGGEY